MFRLLALVGAFTISLCAQLPQNWAGAGAAYNSYAAPNVNGWASYAYLLSDRAQLYSFTTMDVSSARTHPFTTQTSTRTGLATVVKQIGPVYVLGLGDIGAAFGGQSLSGAYSGGGVAVVKLGKSSWSLVLGARVLQTKMGGTQTVYEFGIGREY